MITVVVDKNIADQSINYSSVSTDGGANGTLRRKDEEPLTVKSIKPLPRKEDKFENIREENLHI
jgi:hypothetical protein